MIADSIERDILIDAPPEAVWRIVSDPGQIPRWFADEASFDVRPGGDGTLTFRHGREEPMVHRIRLATVEPPRVFGYRWGHPEGEEPTARNSMLVEFTLTPEGGGTRLRLVESGLHAVDWDEARKREYLTDHILGWDAFLPRLVDAGAGAVR